MLRSEYKIGVFGVRNYVWCLYFRSESEELNEEDIMAVVNETAQQGLAFFGNLLGFAFGRPQSNQTKSDEGSSTPSPTARHANQQR